MSSSLRKRIGRAYVNTYRNAIAKSKMDRERYIVKNVPSDIDKYALFCISDQITAIMDDYQRGALTVQDVIDAVQKVVCDNRELLQYFPGFVDKLITVAF